MKILGVMSDLFFSVKIMDGAKRLGMSAEFVKDADRALKKIAASPPLVIVDLNCGSARPMDLIRAIKGNPATQSIPVVAFVSHVQTDLKREALEAGCDEVVARFVFAQNLDAIMQARATHPA